MALRECTDASGVAWQVWHVVPTPLTTAPPVAPADRRKRSESDLLIERRRRGLTLTAGMEGGWLCFESASAKRRLTPVPADWESCGEARLAEYLASAIPVARPVRERGRTDQPEDQSQATHAHPR